MNYIIEFICKIADKIGDFLGKYIILILGALTIYWLIMAHYYRDKFRECENAYKTALAVQETKQEYVDKIITKEIVIYKDKIRYIQEAKIDENKTVCENALSLLRDSF